MKKLIALFALSTTLLTACPSTPTTGTTIPTTGGTVSSSDNQAVLTAASASSGTFAQVNLSSDQGSLPSGLTFVSAYDFQVTAGSVGTASIQIQFAQAVAPAPNQIGNMTTRKGEPIYRLYHRDGQFWRYVTGQTSTNTSLSASVSSFGVYAILNGIATIKDIVITPTSVDVLNNIGVGTTLQFNALVRDSLDQTMPAIDSAVTWYLFDPKTAAASHNPVRAVPVAPVPVASNSIDATGLLTANVTGDYSITATTQQNVTSTVPIRIVANAL